MDLSIGILALTGKYDISGVLCLAAIPILFFAIAAYAKGPVSGAGLNATLCILCALMFADPSSVTPDDSIIGELVRNNRGLWIGNSTGTRFMSKSLTHYYAKQPAQYHTFANLPNPNFLNHDLLRKFLESLQPMGSKLGSIVFQFEYLNKQKMSSLNLLLDYLSEFFSSAPKEFDYALELRNPNYLTEDLNRFLREMTLSPVLIDGYYMPPLTEVAGKIDLSAGKSLILRLQGPDRQGIEKQSRNKWNKIIAPQDAGIDTVAGIIKGQIKKGKKVIVNINNHYEGCAPLTIERIMEKIQP